MQLLSKCASSSRCAVCAAGKGKKSSPVPPPPEEPELLEVLPSKKFELPARQPAQRTSYKRKTNKEDVAAAKAMRRLERQETERRLAMPAPPRPVSKPPVMLIDAYNCLFSDPYLEEWMKKEPQYARGELEKWVAAYADAANIKCQLVYDAMGSHTKSQGSFTQVSKRVVAIFVSKREADTYICKKAWNYKDKGASEVIVVSSDSQIMIGVQDEDVVITCREAEDFMQVIKACAKGITSGIRRYNTLPGAASASSWYARRSSAAAQQAQAKQQAARQASAQASAEAAARGLDLEDALERILWKHGSLLSLEDLCDNDDDCEGEGWAENGDGSKGGEEKEGENDSLDLDLDELLRKRIV